MEIRLFLPIITLGPVNPVNPPGNTQRAVISHQWHYPETQRKTTKAKNFHKQIFAAMGNIAQKEEKKERRKEGRKKKENRWKTTRRARNNSPYKVELGEPSSQCFASVLAFTLQLHNLSIERPYGVMRLVDRSYQIASFAFPPLHSIELGASPTELGFDFFAEAALCRRVFC